MSIPFIDLKAQYREMEEDIREAIHRVLEHGRYVMGPEIFELEKELADFVGVKEVVSCSSGTDALIMPLMAYSMKPGDGVFTTPFTFVATAEAIALTGATPIFVDIDPKTFNIDPNKLEEAIIKTKQRGTPFAKGIIPVDLFGLPADYDAIHDIAERHSLFVLEDAAQSLGAIYKGKRAGAFGDVAATSFFPAKPLGCYGDGGAIFTNNSELAEKMRSIRIHGQGSDKYENIQLGINGRLDSIQAAILNVKLKAFKKELDSRQQVAEQYGRSLTSVETPFIPEGYRSAWAQYSVLSDQREEKLKALQEAGIPAAIYYKKPLHLQLAFSNLGYKQGDFPVSEAASKRIFSLPMHPYLNEADIARIAETLNPKA